MPRGPRRNLRPVPARKSQRSAATSTANCPTAWQASIRYGTPSSAHTSPTAPASCTNPELVGTQLSATRRVPGWRASWRTLAGSTPPSGRSSARTVSTAARPEVEGGHRLAEGHGRILDDRHVSGRCAHHPPQQLVRLPYHGLGFVFCLVAPNRRLALEMRRDR